VAEPKGGLAGVLGAPSKSEGDDGAADLDAAKSDAAAAAVSAAKADDAEGFKLAMQDFVQLCMDSGEY
jgi:hypothetical protein